MFWISEELFAPGGKSMLLTTRRQSSDVVFRCVVFFAFHPQCCPSAQYGLQNLISEKPFDGTAQAIINVFDF